MADYDKRFYSSLYGEAAGGNPEEMAAVASVFINLVDKLGYEKALKRSAAYTKKSPQYLKAYEGNLSAFERMKYNIFKDIADNLIEDPSLKTRPAASPESLFTHFENVNRFGEPPLEAGFPSNYQDIGRQRFYYE